MIKQRKTVWLAIISSLILASLLLAACNGGVPEEMPSTQTDSVESESDNAVTDTSEDTEIVSDITEIFETTSDNSDMNSNSTDAAPADTEVDVNGVPIGFTENGNPYRGNINAPIVIEEFSDFQ